MLQVGGERVLASDVQQDTLVHGASKRDAGTAGRQTSLDSEYTNVADRRSQPTPRGDIRAAPLAFGLAFRGRFG
jgi:hypothetical protein